MSKLLFSNLKARGPRERSCECTKLYIYIFFFFGACNAACLLKPDGCVSTQNLATVYLFTVPSGLKYIIEGRDSDFISFIIPSRPEGVTEGSGTGKK